MPNPKYAPIVQSKTVDGVKATALVGVHSAIIGWTTEASNIGKDHLGFAVKRTDYDAKTGKEINSGFLLSDKRFEGIKEDVREVGSDEAPFQRFRWNDYGLRPDKRYSYEIFPANGKPGNLKLGKPVPAEVTPSQPVMGNLGVYFNRGVTSAHAYLNRFRGKHPKDVANNEAYSWLSRGLKESLIEFINATKPGQALHVCIYEFFDPDVASALAAATPNVDVTIVYHAKVGDRATGESLENIKHHKLTKFVKARIDTGAISHNKFVVRLENDKARAVWTGSSNFSENAFYFQTNSALAIDIPAIAQIYEDFFQVVAKNPKLARASKTVVFAQDSVNAVNLAFKPKEPFSRAYFSPVRNLDFLDAAIDLITKAQSAVFVSAPFATDKSLVEALMKNKASVLEYGLVNATAKKKIAGLDVRHMRFIVPSTLKTYMGQKWDAKAFGAHKIHSKMIVTDPWSDNPRVLVGSSNHSDASCKKNDENNLLIEGDSRLAAIMTVEFMRMFDHYNSRAFINEILKNGGTAGKPLETNSSWARTAFSETAKSHKFRDRLVFSGQL